jgi:hypothetical protein
MDDMKGPPAVKHQLLADAAGEAAKAAPPVAVVSAGQVLGLTLQDAVYIATLVYVALQAGWLVWKWRRAAKTKGWTPHEE